MFEAVNDGEKLLAEKVSEQIVSLIASRNLVSGQQLPNEFELAKSLKVGRGTVREAVKLLVSRNVLQVRRGRGTFVTKDPGMVDDPLGLTFFQDKFKLALDLYEIRYMLEPQIAALAAQKATDRDVLEMKEICADVDTLAAAGESFVRKDSELHSRIAQSTRNLVIPNLIPVIDNGIELLNIFPRREERLKALQIHHDIIGAIEAHDAARAADAMKRHLDYNIQSLSSLEQAYSRRQTSPAAE